MPPIFERLVGLLQIGGPVVAILAAMSVLVATLLLVKLWQFYAAGLFSRRSQSNAERVVSAWKAGDHDYAIAEARNRREPLSQLLASTAKRLQAGRLSSQELNEELSREANARLAPLRSQLRTIELVAGLAPLLGLLGTVLGMITAFQAMELAGNQVDPATLSGGIWQALLTTAVGLAVAMPAMVIHNFLERRVEHYATTMADCVGRMLTASRAAAPLPTLAPVPSATASPSAQPLELARARG